MLQKNIVKQPKAQVEVQISLPWADLEPRKGVYNFTVIQSLLDLVASYDKYLTIEFRDRCMGCGTPYIFPSYLINEGLIAPTTSGYIAKVWDGRIIDYELALFSAFSIQFDAHPYLAGIVTPESATGVATRPFSFQQLTDQYKRLITGMHKALPTTLFLHGFNWLGGPNDRIYLDQLVASADINASGIRWPDTIPPRCVSVDWAAPAIEQEIGNKLPKQAHIATVNLQKCSPPTTVEELYNYAVKTLNAHYLIWVSWAVSPAPYDFYRDVVPFVTAHPTTNIQCPENIRCQ